MFVQRTARKIRAEEPDVAAQLVAVLREAPTRSSPLRRAQATPLPVDVDTRLALLRVEHPAMVQVEPIFSEHVQRELDQIIAERAHQDRLLAAGLEPARAVLLVGPPGVGKTLTARWLAQELGLPLMVLDLAAVMSSLLGRTGTNLRHVIEYAKTQPCVLLLDELDSIAKRRQDDLDVGELKRLVTVLLQQIDEWPSDSGLLVAATNHPELLDPAVWRRFDVTLDLPLPGLEARRLAVAEFGGRELSSPAVEVLALSSDGGSFNDIEREIGRIRRSAALNEVPLEVALLASAAERIQRQPIDSRRAIARALVSSEVTSQRRAHEITGISRDTIRKDLAGASHP